MQPATVRVHLKRIYAKTGTRGMSDLVVRLHRLVPLTPLSMA